MLCESRGSSRRAGESPRSTNGVFFGFGPAEYHGNTYGDPRRFAFELNYEFGGR